MASRGAPIEGRDPHSRQPAMRAARILACAAFLALAGCAYYPYPAPGAAPASFDRSFAAAASAIRDQGLPVSVEDRSSGTIVGQAGSGTVTASVRQQADGSVRVQFNAAGVADRGLIERVSRSYDARMGR